MKNARKSRSGFFAAIALAWLTYRFVETPIRQKGGYRTALALAAAMVLLTVAALGIVRLNGLADRAALRNSTFNANVARQFTGSIWEYTENASCLNRFPMKESKGFQWWFCMLERDQPPTFLLLGTSYANQLYPGMAARPELSQHNFLSIGTCDPSHAEGAPNTDEGRDSPCYGERAARQEDFINRIVTENKSVQYAIFDGLSRAPDATYIRNLKQRIDFFEKQGVQVFLFYPHLRVDFDIRTCFSRPLAPVTQSCTVPLSLRQDLNAHFKPLVDSIHASNPKVLFFDQNDLFCNQKECNLIRDGLPLYRDGSHHISEYGSGLVAQQFVDFLRQNLPQALK